LANVFKAYLKQRLDLFGLLSYLDSSSDNNEVVSNACYDNITYGIYNVGSGNFFQYNSYGTSSGV
jgi:hypothetical protein